MHRKFGFKILHFNIMCNILNIINRTNINEVSFQPIFCAFSIIFYLSIFKYLYIENCITFIIIIFLRAFYGQFVLMYYYCIKCFFFFFNIFALSTKLRKLFCLIRHYLIVFCVYYIYYLLFAIFL